MNVIKVLLSILVFPPNVFNPDFLDNSQNLKLTIAIVTDDDSRYNPQIWKRICLNMVYIFYEAIWNKDALKCPEEMAKVVNILPGEESHWLNFFLLRVRLKKTMKRCFLFCLAWYHISWYLCVCVHHTAWKNRCQYYCCYCCCYCEVDLFLLLHKEYICFSFSCCWFAMNKIIFLALQFLFVFLNSPAMTVLFLNALISERLFLSQFYT